MSTTLPKHISAARKAKSALLLKKYLELKPTSWDQIKILIKERLDIELPAAYCIGPVSYMQTEKFLGNWAAGQFEPVVIPNTTSLTPSIERKVNDLANHSVEISNNLPNQFGKSQLFPEQYDTYCNIVNAFKTESGGLQNGSTGSGKTYLAAALFHKYGVQDKLHEQGLNRFRSCPYIFFTRKTIVRQTQEVFKEFGLGDLMNRGKLKVVPYSHLSSTKGGVYVTKEFDSFENAWTVTWHLTAVPFLAIFDECQALCNPLTKQTLAYYALIKASKTMPCKILNMSATPFDTVLKAHSVVSAFRKPFEYEGRKFSVSCFGDWELAAGFIAEDPAKSNSAAMARLRKSISGNIFEIANVRWPARARNRTIAVDFELPEHRIIYDNAYNKYLENIKKLGRDASTNPLQEYIEINIFSKIVEPLRNYAMVQLAMKDLAAGKCPVFGVRFKSTITDLVFKLMEQGLKREDISIIWGGGADYDEENTYNDAEFKQRVEKLAAGFGASKEEMRKLRRTIAFREELTISGQSSAQGLEKYSKLRDLDMTGSQSSDQRWDEITRFQTGRSKVCIFTIAAGGVGLSLDRNKTELGERVLYGGLCWSGPDYKQMLGRLVRRATLPGYVDQYLVFMKDTVEEFSLMPVVGRKLANIKEIGSSGIDPTEVLLCNDRIASQVLSVEELTRLADSDLSQLGADTEEDEDEDE